MSPYPYKTAKEHYEALMAAAKAKGGPTVYTKATTPDWDGYYARDQQADHGAEWIWGTVNQVPTILSLLTPEYQKRMVQMNYHEAVDNAPQWEASFCYPEGFLRWWTQASQGRKFPAHNDPMERSVPFRHRGQLPAPGPDRKGACAKGPAVVRRNGWILGRNHSGYLDRECSGLDAVALDVRIQRQDRDGGNLEAGIRRRAASSTGSITNRYSTIPRPSYSRCVPPIVTCGRQPRTDPNRRYTYIECLSNLRNTNGRPTQLTKADPRYIDYYGRPWAQNWEKYFEEGWDKPQDSGVPQDILNLFK